MKKFPSVPQLCHAGRLAGLVKSPDTASFKSRCWYHIRECLADPGDMKGDYPMIYALGIATAEHGQGAGWIPQVQALACKLSELPEFKRLEFLSTPDPRYTVFLEYCGDEVPRYVARFCGEWISKHAIERQAVIATHHAYAARMEHAHRVAVLAKLLEGETANA